MKNKLAWLGACVLLGGLSVDAQEKTSLKIADAIHLAVTQSKEAKATTTKVASKELEVGVAKNRMLPDVSFGGQFFLMSEPNVDLKLPMTGAGGAPLSTNYLYYGSATASVPLYAGGKIKQGIKISETALEIEKFSSLRVKDQLAHQTIQAYVALSKAQQTVVLMQENIKRANQRVVDFKAMETNGVIARNDLLKAELQLSNYKVALQDAEKNVAVLNYQLVTLLQLDEGTEIAEIKFSDADVAEETIDTNNAAENRSDIKIVELSRNLALQEVKMSKSEYLPKVSFTAGYNALGLQNVVDVRDAMMVGLGLSYDLSSFYKNKKHVNIAKNKASQTQQQLEILNDRVKIEVFEADKNYQLAKEQQNVYEAALVQAEENYRIVKDKFTNGVADTDDLLEADVQKVQSQINLTIANANIIEKYYDLLVSNGQLTSTY